MCRQNKVFPITKSYTDARKNLASLLDRIESENAIALITRRGHKDIANQYLPKDLKPSHRLLVAVSLLVFKS